MQNKELVKAIDKLAFDFDNIHWTYLDMTPENDYERIQLWPGAADEDIMICVYKGKQFLEQFHRQNFFFFNYAYKGDYSALSFKSSNRITVHKGECYIGQPYAGYAINDTSLDETIIIGVLIQKDAFFKTFFNVLAADKSLFDFFLTPQKDEKSDDYIHLRFSDEWVVRSLLELMIVEYANPKTDTQAVLRPLVLTLLMQVAREYKNSNVRKQEMTVVEQVVQYISENFAHVSLADLSSHFSYHPNYLSGLLTKELGKTFSQVVLEQRMQRAVSLLQGTSLPISEIADMLGYSNSSNFYKAFREYYHASPRDFLAQNK